MIKEMADKAVEAFTTGYVQLEPINPLSPATGGVAASEGHCESKEQVFEALLARWSNAMLWKTDKTKELALWRDRYEKADAKEYGYHDVEDLYDSPTEGQEE